MRLIDLTGKRFGRLTVIEKNYSKNHTSWLCKCSCGNLKIIQGCNLKSGHTISCGCYQKEIASIHKMSRTRVYKTWMSMKIRCYNKNHKQYKDYGGRGIKVCDYWLESFENFYKDMGDRPKGLTIDRIDNNGNYTPENCRWATWIEQMNNTRNNNFYTYKGEKKTIAEFCRKYNINRGTLKSRLRKNKSIEEAIETPLYQRN